MRKIEDLLPSAIKAVEKYIAKGNKVPLPFKGYISSFGASVIHSSLLPTLAFYSESKGAKGDRSMLIPAMLYVLNEGKIIILDDVTKKTLHEIEKFPEELPAKMYIFFQWILKEDTNALTSKLNKASVALKLALRIFEPENLKKKKNE